MIIASKTFLHREEQKLFIHRLPLIEFCTDVCVRKTSKRANVLFS